MARIGIISDIHSNLAALKAVIDAVDSVHEWWCMGDIVGYGPDPNEVIELISDLRVTCVRGNHDEGVLSPSERDWFNSAARLALEWNAQQLSARSWEFLRALPNSIAVNGIRLVHGSPREELTEYVTDSLIADAALQLIAEDICFIGHTHVASSFIQPAGQSSVDVSKRLDGDSIRLEPGQRFILNAGSVGQPRDGDPRAAYGIFDTAANTFTWHRVPYGIDVTQEKMRVAELPEKLIERLSEGW